VILRQVLAGRANKVVARSAGISEQTVKEHVSALLIHFSVDNRIALIRYFADRRLTISAPANGQDDSHD
jgi:DNA-binding NarL/FixJ family response regulator